MSEPTIGNCLSCCRLCLTEKHEDLSNVFDEDSTLVQRISHSLSVDITTSDKLSTLVCAQCVEKINNWHAFKEECTLNQNKLELRKNFSSFNEINTIKHTTDLTSHDFRVIFFYNFKRGLSAKQCHDQMEWSLGTNCISLSNVKRWFKKFRSGIFELDSKYGRKDITREVDFVIKDTMHIKTNNNRENEAANQRFQEKQSNKSFDEDDSMFHENIQIKPEPHVEDEDIDHQHTEEVEPETPELQNGDIMNESLNEPRIKPEPVEEEYNEFPPELTPSDSLLTPQFNLLDSEDSQNSSGSIVNSHTCRYCNKYFSSSANRLRHERNQHSAPRQSNIGSDIGTEDSQTSESQTSEVPEKVVQKVIDEAEQEKIQFAAGLKLLQKDATIISMEALSKIEMSYIEKCKAMVTMHNTLICACHNAFHTNIKGLLSHLRALRIWFPVFTCYNCMITFTDRSAFTKHMVICKKTPLEAITSLSNLKKRSTVKTRLYQNYKCTECKFMYSFHEEFCKHVDEAHTNEAPYVCSCSRTFENLDEYKDHVYVSCLVQYYCDICFVTVKSLDGFVKHAQDKHDNSEGFILLQDDGYKRKSLPVKEKVVKETKEAEVLVVSGKRRSSFYNKSVKDMMEPEEPRETKKRKSIPNAPPLNNDRPGLCPICFKEYSSYHNMLRHWKTHNEQKPINSIEVGKDTSIYSCPDCGGMFSATEWQTHLAENHETKSCGECGKVFQFNTELEQHRSVHLNLKISRDSKTHSYRSTMLSPNQETPIIMMCEVCDETFTSKDELKIHKLQVHDFVTKEEPLDEPETLVSDVEVKKSKFSCLECDKHYQGYSGLWDHNKRKHPHIKPNSSAYPKKCKICDKVCTTGAAYNTHKAMHDRMNHMAENNQNRPPLLKPATPNIDNKEKKKVADDEDEDYHTCKKCFKVFANRSNLKNHMKCHGISHAGKSKISKKVWCDFCHLSCNNQEALRKHKEDEHSIDEEMPDLESEIDNLDAKIPFIFTCDICVMTFTTKNGLKKHKDTHKSETTIYKATSKVHCRHCKISFDTVTKLASHMREEHDEKLKTKVPKTKDTKNFACSICGKSYDNAGGLTAHLGWHSRQPNAKAVLKPTKLVKQNKVIEKLATATVSKQKEQKRTPPEFQCTTCLQELPNDTALQIHILEKHRNIDAIMLVPRCHTCNQDFNSQDEYETHKRLHDLLERQKKHNETIKVEPVTTITKKLPVKPLKNFHCRYCPLAFSKQDTMNVHVRQKHKELMPTEFICNYCDRVFEKQNALSIHIKVHEKNKNNQANNAGNAMFSCSICNMGFDLPKDLRAHTINAHPF